MMYLVTGACGFIGARVADLLIQAGHTVVGIDDMNDSTDGTLKKWRLAQLSPFPNFQFHHSSIVDRRALRSILATLNSPPAAIINLAARAGVRASVSDPWTYYDTNVNGTLNLLELCQEAGIGKFVLASTSSLYGSSNALPFCEEADTDEPLSPYSASKKAAETLCHVYHHLYGIDVTVFRYFTVYGPAGRPDMSPLRFVQWIIEEKPVQVFGDGRQSRDFTYIDDIAAGTVAGLQPLGYEIINLGADRAVVLLDIIHLIEDLTRKKAVIEYHERQDTDMPATWADIRKAGDLLGWQPEVGVEEGFKRLVDWYRENRDWAREIKT